MGHLSQNQGASAAPKAGGNSVCHSRCDLGDRLVVEHGPSPGERPGSGTGLILTPSLGYEDTYGYWVGPPQAGCGDRVPGGRGLLVSQPCTKGQLPPPRAWAGEAGPVQAPHGSGGSLQGRIDCAQPPGIRPAARQCLTPRPSTRDELLQFVQFQKYPL